MSQDRIMKMLVSTAEEGTWVFLDSGSLLLSVIFPFRIDYWKLAFIHLMYFYLKQYRRLTQTKNISWSLLSSRKVTVILHWLRIKSWALE